VGTPASSVFTAFSSSAEEQAIGIAQSMSKRPIRVFLVMARRLSGIRNPEVPRCNRLEIRHQSLLKGLCRRVLGFLNVLCATSVQQHKGKQRSTVPCSALLCSALLSSFTPRFQIVEVI
jgi:hypothetical protein